MAMDTLENRLSSNKSLLEFAKLFTKIKDPGEMKTLMEELFTEAELNDFVKRIQLLKALKEGKPQRTIAKEFHLSLCKITRGSKILKQKDAIINKLLNDKIDEQ